METLDDCFKDSRATRAGMEQEIAHDEFVDLVLGLCGSNTATVKDLVDLRRAVRKTQKAMARHVDALKNCVESSCPSWAKPHSTDFQEHTVVAAL